MNFIGSFVCCSDDSHDDEGEMRFLQELGFGDNNSRLGSEDSLHWNFDRSKAYSLHSGNNTVNNSNHGHGGDIITGMSNMFSFNPIQNTAQNPTSTGDSRVDCSSTNKLDALNIPLNTLTVAEHHSITEECLPVLMDDEEKALIERAIADESFDGSVSSSVHDLEMYDQLSVDHFWNAVSYNPMIDGDGSDEDSILREIEGMIASVTDPVGKVGLLLI